jgi:hypothetical protein
MEGTDVLSVIKCIAHENKTLAKIHLAEYHYVPRMASQKGRLKIRELSISGKSDLRAILSGVGDNLDTNWQLGLMSLARKRSGQSCHIPQIDFVCEKTSENIAAIKACLKQNTYTETGWLVDSGNSFHFYGRKLLAPSDWQAFMGQCLLFNERGKYPIIDWRWLGYSLIAGYSTLRILKSSSKREPRVIEKYN